MGRYRRGRRGGGDALSRAASLECGSALLPGLPSRQSLALLLAKPGQHLVGLLGLLVQHGLVANEFCLVVGDHADFTLGLLLLHPEPPLLLAQCGEESGLLVLRHRFVGEASQELVGIVGDEERCGGRQSRRALVIADRRADDGRAQTVNAIA